MTDLIQIHLNGLHCSGRAVRLRQLTPDQTTKVAENAAKVVGEKGTVLEMRMAEIKEGIKAMLVSVTEPVKDPMSKDVKWEELSAEKKELDYSKLFTSKDDAILSSLYREYNEVSKTEVDAIAGKALMVSVD